MRTIIVALLLILLGFGLYKYMGNKDYFNKQDSVSQKKNVDKTNVDALSSKSEVSGGNSVVYYKNASGKEYTGFYAEPVAPGNYPGIVMIHEWWGLNDNIKKMAVELSKQGYKVLAVDLYGRPVTTDPNEAKKLTTSVSTSEAVSNMKSAVSFLRNKGSNKLASLGWCYGGGKSLALALSGESLNAVVIYYGTPLVTDKNELASIPAPVLGIFGDKDTAIPLEQVQEFKSGLIQNDIKNDIEIYPGVGHAFANPSGANYAPEATKDAWAKTLKFLKENLK